MKLQQKKTYIQIKLIKNINNTILKKEKQTAIVDAKHFMACRVKICDHVICGHCTQSPKMLYAFFSYS